MIFIASVLHRHSLKKVVSIDTCTFQINIQTCKLSENRKWFIFITRRQYIHYNLYFGNMGTIIGGNWNYHYFYANCFLFFPKHLLTLVSSFSIIDM